MMATADSERMTVSPGRRCGPACSRMTPAMSSPGISTGVRIGIRSKVRPSTATMRGAGPGGVIAPDGTGALRHPGGCDPDRAHLRSRPMRPRSHLRLGALAAAVALVVLAGAATSFSPSPARGMGALPGCRYDDIMTTPRGYDDWATTLVDTILRIPKSYVPPDLVSVSQAGIAGHGKIR